LTKIKQRLNEFEFLQIFLKMVRRKAKKKEIKITFKSIDFRKNVSLLGQLGLHNPLNDRHRVRKVRQFMQVSAVSNFLLPRHCLKQLERLPLESIFSLP
jgi:hypothetical protein